MDGWGSPQVAITRGDVGCYVCFVSTLHNISQTTQPCSTYSENRIYVVPTSTTFSLLSVHLMQTHANLTTQHLQYYFCCQAKQDRSDHLLTYIKHQNEIHTGNYHGQPMQLKSYTTNYYMIATPILTKTRNLSFQKWR